MYTEESIRNKIRQNHRSKVWQYIACMFVLPSLFFLSVYSTSSNMLDSSSGLIYLISMIIFGIIVSFIVDYFIIWKHYISPALKEAATDGDTVFRSFKNISELTAAINEVVSSEKIYEHGQFFFTYQYIVDLNNPATIMRLEDITDVSLSVDAHNTDGEMVVVKDKYNRTCHFSMDGDPNAAAHVRDLLYKHSPNLEKPKDNSMSA